MPEYQARLRFHRLWLAIGCLLIAVVVWLSLAPVSIEIPLENSDKLEHALAYGSLMFWFGMLHPATRTRTFIALAFCGMGVGIEFLQGTTAYRSFEVADMLANATGVAIGWGVACTPLQFALVWIENLISRKVST